MGFEVPIALAGWRGWLRPECFEFRSQLEAIVAGETNLGVLGVNTSVWAEQVVVHRLSAKAAERGHRALHAVRTLGPFWPRPFGYLAQGAQGRLFVEYVAAPPLAVLWPQASLRERRAWIRALGECCRPLWQNRWAHGGLDLAHVCWDGGPILLSPQHLRRGRVWSLGAFCGGRTDRARFLSALVRHAPDRDATLRQLWRRWAAFAPFAPNV